MQETDKALELRYYVAPTRQNLSVFEVWETGGNVGDSITPATYWPQYRNWIRGLVEELLDRDTSRRILSVGCGNAFVEGELCSSGYRVLGLDIHELAVSFARQKGVDAHMQDFDKWEPPTEQFDLAYCDGIFGHLYREATGLGNVLLKLSRSLVHRGWILISNDASHSTLPVQKHPTVPGFHWFSPDYVEQQLLQHGFGDICTRSYEYDRPESGPRTRLVVTAQKRT